MNFPALEKRQGAQMNGSPRAGAGDSVVIRFVPDISRNAGGRGWYRRARLRLWPRAVLTLLAKVERVQLALHHAGAAAALEPLVIDRHAGARAAPSAAYRAVTLQPELRGPQTPRRYSRTCACRAHRVRAILCICVRICPVMA